MSILVFLVLSVLDLGPIHATDVRGQTSDAHHRLMLPLCGGDIKKESRAIISKNVPCTAHDRKLCLSKGLLCRIPLEELLMVVHNPGHS